MRAWQLLLLLLPRPAFAVEPPWYANLPVADVRLLSPEGALPDDSLEPVLRATEGAPLTMHQLRLDIATLFRVGEFSAVEADVEPWVIYDDAGELVEAVLLTYIVHAAPKVATVTVEGHEWVRRARVLEASRVGVGQLFYASLDVPEIEARVEADLERRGFPEAECTVLIEGPPHALEITIVVDEGTPTLVDTLAFAGDTPVPERALRRWARKADVRQGKPMSTRAVGDGQERIRKKLAQLGGFFRKNRGFVSARVTPAVTGDGQGGTLVTYTIEQGPRLEIEVTGLRWQKRRKAIEGLGINERVRITRGWIAGAPDRMDTYLETQGYYAAKSSVALEVDAEERFQVLKVDVDRGPLHILHRVDSEGNEAIRDKDLRLAMDAASDTVLRLNRVTEPELAKGVTAVRDLYRSRGYLSASATLTDLRITDKLTELEPNGRPPLWRSLTRPFNPKAVFLIPRVTIQEGALTRLVDLEFESVASEVDLSAATKKRDELVGGPYSPQALEALAREVVKAHRSAGYLEADARVVREPRADGEMAAVIGVEPGVLVRLRSVVVRGAQVTRPQVIRREVPLELGDPVTAETLETLRRSLYELGIFRNVDTSLIGDEAARDLVLAVEERPLWAFEFGGGIATDQGIRAFGRATQRNLWGLAHKIDFYGLIGFDWQGTTITSWIPDFRSPEWRAAVSYTAPRFPLRNQQIVIDVLLRERMQERTYQLGRSGAAINLDTNLGVRTSLRVGVNWEARRFEEVDPGALLPGEVWTEIVDPLNPQTPTASRPSGSTYIALIQDMRDNPLQPTRGLVMSLQGIWSPGMPWTDPTLSKVDWLKGEVRISGYIPIAGIVLKLTGETQAAWMYKGGIVPLDDRFRLGGTGSLRGFRRDYVGPQNQVQQFSTDWPPQLAPAIEYASRSDPTRWVPTGGDLRASGVVEFLIPLPALGLRSWDGYSLALFTDVGNNWLVNKDARGVATSTQDPWPDIYSPILRYSVGAGARVATPVGPLQVDLALNPEAIRASGARKELIRVDWDEPTWRFHLALGAL